MRTLEFTVSRECTLGDFLRRDRGFSASAVRRLKQTPDGVRVNGRFARTVDKVFPGDCVTALIEDRKCSAAPNFSLFSEVVYEDDDVIIFNKPDNMPVHQSIRHRDDTLANVFAARCEKSGVQAAFRPINRLDRNTSGLCAAAKNSVAAYKLSKTLQKEYTAICEGSLINDSGRIDAPIAREGESIIRRTVDEGGQRAVTNYTVFKRIDGATAVRVRLETGRTHQIRVHFAYIGHPLLGDELYGGDASLIKRQALHCSKLEFIHPVTGESVKINSELPEDMKRILNEND